jgi:hypothetical protein
MLYFGCKGDKGHCLWTWDGSPARRYEAILKDAGLYPKVDSGFCPQNNGQRQGEYLLIHINGWTILAWWDRTVDTRPGSHSTFLKHGTWTAEEMLHWAWELHSEVMLRQTVQPFPREVEDSLELNEMEREG